MVGIRPPPNGRRGLRQAAQCSSVQFSALRPRYRGARRSEEHTSELQSPVHLHSFPTRRSSDLPSRLESRATEVFSVLSAMGIGRRRRHLEKIDGKWSASGRRRMDGAACARRLSAVQCSSVHCDPGIEVREDRKSTRLNSSHPSISTLSLHDALPIYLRDSKAAPPRSSRFCQQWESVGGGGTLRKSTANGRHPAAAEWTARLAPGGSVQFSAVQCTATPV